MSDEPSTDDEPSPLRRLLRSWLRLGGYGLAATAGGLALVDGFQRYLEYLEGGVNQPSTYLFGVLVVLWVGFTLLLVALAGGVSSGLRKAD